jgi:hypothetical protein
MKCRPRRLGNKLSIYSLDVQPVSETRLNGRTEHETYCTSDQFAEVRYQGMMKPAFSLSDSSLSVLAESDPLQGKGVGPSQRIPVERTRELSATIIQLTDTPSRSLTHTGGLRSIPFVYRSTGGKFVTLADAARRCLDYRSVSRRTLHAEVSAYEAFVVAQSFTCRM